MLRALALAAALPAAVLGQTYTLFRNHAGASFFDGLYFQGGYDNTTTGP